MQYLLIERQQTPGWRERCFCGEGKKNNSTKCVPDFKGKFNKERCGRVMTYLGAKAFNTITKAPALFGFFSAVLEQP